MANTATLYGSSAANLTGIGTAAWSNPSNAVGNNTSNLTTAAASVNLVSGSPPGKTSNYLNVTFTHGLLSTDTIVGVQIAFRRMATLNDTDPPALNSLKLVKNGAIAGNEKSDGVNFPQTTPAYSATYGGIADLATYWGITATGSDTIGIGISVAAPDANDFAYIFAATAIFYYTSSGSSVLKSTGFLIGVV